MTQDIKELLPKDYAGDSRVWIYQASRQFGYEEMLQINEQLEMFYTQWLSHGAVVKGWAALLYRQFVVVLADEKACGVSGCSTDGMVRIVKSLERQYNVQLFDRLTITFLVDGKPEMLPLGQINYALEKGYITQDTELFDNTVTTKEELEMRWLVPLNDTWLAKRLNLA